MRSSTSILETVANQIAMNLAGKHAQYIIIVKSTVISSTSEELVTPIPETAITT